MRLDPASFPDPATAGGATGTESWLRHVARPSTAPAVAESWPPLLPGAPLRGGRIVVGKLLGRGGMGAVYDVYDAGRGIHLAAKTLLDSRPERLLAFKNEFRALQDVLHPNLVELDEFFEDSGRWYFTMERITGLPFTRFVRPDAPAASPDGRRTLDVGRLRRSLVQLATGLRALHRAGKIHRDVKPSNALVESSGRVVLLDFGLIADVTGRPGTRGDLCGGTVVYMAPEQAVGQDGTAADWYSTGVMLYEALTGEVPFDGPAEIVLARKLAEAPPSPSARAPDVPADLEELCLRLLERDPTRRADGHELLLRLRGARPKAAPAARRVDDDPRTFVGRASELERLTRALEDVQRHPPGVAVIRGESGVGKTALLARFLADLDADVLVLHGRCHEREFVPFKALDGLVDALARHLAGIDGIDLRRILPAGVGALAGMFPVLRDIQRRAGLDPDPDHVPATGPQPHEARRRALGALRELLSRLAECQPLVLAIDDLQWADIDSTAAIEELLCAPEPPPVLLVLAIRPGTPLPQIFDKAAVIDLGVLGRDEGTELARRLLASRGASPSVDPAALAKEAGQHPLFIETLADQCGDNRRWIGPLGLDQALAARVSALGGSARHVLEVVSVAVQPLPLAVAARALAMSPERLQRIARVLSTDHLLLTSSRHSVQPAIEPYHDRVRSAVVDRLSPPCLQRCHLAIADALAELAPQHPEALAFHFYAAGDSIRARTHALAAGDRARQTLAFDRAATFYRLALDIDVGDPASAGPGHAELQRWYAEALANAGRGAEAAAAFQSAAHGAPAGQRLDLERCAAEQLLRAGHIDEGLGAMDRLLPSLRMARPRGIAGAAMHLLREAVLSLLAPITARIRSRRSRANASAPLGQRADICWALAVGLTHFDPLAGAVFQTRFLRLARQLGDPDLVALGLCLQAPNAAALGPPGTRAKKLLDQAQRLMRGRESPLGTGYLALATGAVAFLLGDWLPALDHGERAVTVFRERCTGVAWELVTAHRFVLDCLWHTGRLRELADRAWTMWREATARGDRYAATQLETTVLPVLHLQRDDVASARQVLDRAWSVRPHASSVLQDWQHTQTLALVELYAGRPADALAAMDRQAGAIQRTLLTRIKAVRVFTLALRATALIAMASASPVGREHWLARADRQARRLHRERAAAETVAFLRGQIAFLRGDDARAVECLVAAQNLFEQRSMMLFSAVARHAAGFIAGGPDGADQMASALCWMRAQKIERPEGFLRLLAPALASTT